MANLFSRSAGSGATRKHSDEVFAVGDRGAILHHLDQAAIIPHVAESEHRKYPYEVRSLPFLAALQTLKAVEASESSAMLAVWLLCDPAGTGCNVDSNISLLLYRYRRRQSVCCELVTADNNTIPLTKMQPQRERYGKPRYSVSQSGV